MSLFGHQPFYFETLEKMNVYFGTIFNNIRITRNDSTTDQTVLLRVPLEYGPKDKLLARVDADPEINRAAAMILPRMSFEMTGMQYASDRKLPDWNRYVRKDNSDADKFRRQFTPVPYDFNFTLWIVAKTVVDANKVLEQINPFFTPSFTATVNLIPEMDIALDLPVNLDSVDYSDDYMGDMAFNNRRIVWTLNFRIMGYMFGPVVSKPIIKLANTQLFVGNTATADTFRERVKVYPGQDANGNATTNSEIAVSNTSVIDVDEEWGYVIVSEQDYAANSI